MKIVLVGVFNDISTNNSLYRGLIKVGCKVKTFDYRVDKNYGHLISLCSQFLPDAVIVCKGNGINREVIYSIKSFCPLVCLWFMDPRSTFEVAPFEYLKGYDIYFVAKWSVYDLLRDKYKMDNVFWVCEGFDEDIDCPLPVNKDIDVSFIGKLDSVRRIEVVKSVGANVYNNCFNRKHAEIVSRTKINLNICRNGDQSDRVYKILSTGGFLLTDKWYGMEKEEFVDRVHLVIFDSVNDLSNKINYFLNNDKEREDIALNGYNFVRNRYSRSQWAKKVVGIIDGYNR